MSEKIMSGTEIVDTVDALEKKIDQVRKAQQIFSTYTQEQVDKIFTDRKSTRLNSSHSRKSRMPSSA